MEYFLWINDDSCGPYSERDLRDALSEGRLSPMTLARHVNGNGWKEIIEYPSMKIAPQVVTAESYYHKPYCHNCRAYVNPQVVSRTVGGGGVQMMVPMGEGFLVSPANSPITSYVKFCSNCGGQVFSQADLDKSAREEKRERNEWMAAYIFLGFVIVGVIVFAFIMLS